jgi:hypothetical protein
MYLIIAVLDSLLLGIKPSTAASPPPNSFLGAHTLAAPGNWTSFWGGTYEYIGSESDSSGPPAVLNLILIIQNDGSCLLMAAGFQTNMAIDCDATPKDNGLVVKFKDFQRGAQSSVFFGLSYTPDEELLLLLPADASHGLTTQWLGLKPTSAGMVKGKFFLAEEGDPKHPVLLDP